MNETPRSMFDMIAEQVKTAKDREYGLTVTLNEDSKQRLVDQSKALGLSQTKYLNLLVENALKMK